MLRIIKGKTLILNKDMTALKRETIRKNLANMMYNMSVMIVILSPNMRKSEWIG